MKSESLPPIKTVYRALEEAAVDLFGFAVVCHGGASWMAEPALLDALFLGLESFWFTEREDGHLSHQEFREDLLKAIWEKSNDKASAVKIGTDVPLGHEEMVFYKLPQMARAALYLRTKKCLSFSRIALVLGSSEGVVRAEVEKAREFLLGRRVKNLDWGGDDF